MQNKLDINFYAKLEYFQFEYFLCKIFQLKTPIPFYLTMQALHCPEKRPRCCGDCFPRETARYFLRPQRTGCWQHQARPSAWGWPRSCRVGFHFGPKRRPRRCKRRGPLQGATVRALRHSSSSSSCSFCWRRGKQGHRMGGTAAVG